MTEEEWLASDNALELRGFVLQHLGARRKAARRKLRLLGCWGCRQLWDEMTDERSRHAVEVAERLADGEATKAEVRAALTGAATADESTRQVGFDPLSAAVANSATYVLSEIATSFSLGGFACSGFPRWSASLGGTPARAVRCIFGNPFRPVEVDPRWLAWNHGTLRRMARSIYEDRAWDQLPVLGDAIEDAGCANEDILAHCREPGPHTRGCWVVDLVLGLE